ncbi:MAG TPA: hypothetical protein VGM78_12050, partial [Ilumatobacteraceae bacterium]
IAMARRVPDMVALGAGSRVMFSAQLYDAIDALPADATVMTDSPQRVWWQTNRNPTLFAFTRPRAGNSNYPLSAKDMLKYACRPDTYLAWFETLGNAGGGPVERRPDLLQVVDLTVTTKVEDGTMYLVTPHDPSQCPR